MGSEIDGKGNHFTRPCLIVHVIGSRLALVVPLSKKVKDVAGYIPFEWKGSTVSLCVHQIRIISQKRVLSRKGRLSPKRLKAIKKEVLKFFALS